MSKARLDAVKELPFVVRAVLELLLALAVGDVVFPLPIVLVALEGVVVNALAVGFIVLDLALIHAPVVITIPALPVRNALQKGAHIIRAILKKELPLPMELVILPLPMIIPPRRLYLLISIGIHPMRVNLLPKLVHL